MKVFWSWQSDTPPKLGKYFVREALDKAVKDLNAELSIEESDRPEVKVDQDREGVPGSPDLAAVIFEKIKDSDVFVADVTTVGKVAGIKGKKLMNPNVAIELGYALGTITDKKLIMVMKGADNARDHLPFDLRHKAGPVLYDVNETDDAASLKLKKNQLAGLLKLKIREIIQANPLPVAEMQVHTPVVAREGDAGRWFPKGHALVVPHSVWEPEDGTAPVYTVPEWPIAYVRLRPTAKTANLSLVEARKLVNFPENFPGLARGGSSQSDNNEYGALRYYADQKGSIFAGCQLMTEREIWAFDLSVLRARKRDGYPDKIIPSGVFESMYLEKLPIYLGTMINILAVPYPIEIECGATGIKGYQIGLPGNELSRPLIKDTVCVVGQISGTDKGELNQFLYKFFTSIFEAAGEERPRMLNGFKG